MGLRKYINDLEFSKKVNYSPKGRRFENSDFARSVELTDIAIKEIFKEKGIAPKVASIYGATIMRPIVYLAMYVTVKNTKRKKYPSYYCFAKIPNLTLNH